MRIVMAGDSIALLDTLHALQVTDTSLSIVGQVHNEGELFRVARTERPEVIVVDSELRLRFTTDWAAYLSEISGGARVIVVYAPHG
ncbi:MAG: hypothetical protein U0641_13330 [Anaerolineae bacterium]